MINTYVHLENIRRFEAMLLKETDPEKRTLISQMLAEERHKDDKTTIPPEAPKA